jgi:hypothetical protein
MADVQTVTVWPASVRETIEYHDTPYKLMDGKAGLLARGAWWLLHKLGALSPFVEKVTRWHFVPREQKALHEAMLAAAGDLRDIYDGSQVFLIGGQTFRDLVGSPVFRNYMVFQTGPFGVNDPYFGRRIFDVPIHVVPNMVGVACVPRVLIEKERAGVL